MRTVINHSQLELNQERGPLQTAITQNMILVGTILAAERTTLYNINELWGAGFEIISYGENGFSKFGDHTFVLVEGRIDKKGELSQLVPKVAQHYHYRGDTLLISAIELLNPESSCDELDEVFTCINNFEAFFLVASLDSDRHLDPSGFLENLSFLSKKVVFGFSVIINDNAVIHPGVYFEASEALVQYDHKHKIGVSLPRQIIDRVRAGVVNAYNTSVE
jgi:hypothetical protein